MEGEWPMFCASQRIYSRRSSAHAIIFEVVMSDASGRNISELLLGLGDDDVVSVGNMSSVDDGNDEY